MDLCKPGKTHEECDALMTRCVMDGFNPDEPCWGMVECSDHADDQHTGPYPIYTCEGHRENKYKSNPSTPKTATIGRDPLLLLKLRNVIACREANTAEANRELQLGGWLFDHGQLDREYADEVAAIMKQF